MSLNPPTIAPVNGYCPPDTFAVQVTVDPTTTSVACFNYIVFDTDALAPDFEGGNIAVLDAVNTGNGVYIVYIPLASTGGCNTTNDYVIIRVCDTNGNLSPYSSALEIFIPPCTVVLQRASRLPEPNENQAVLFIEAPVDASNISSFTAVFQTFDPSLLTVDITVQTGLQGVALPGEQRWYIITSSDPSDALVAGQVYHVAVQAVRTFGPDNQYSTSSCLSNTETIGPEQDLMPPTNVTATPNCSGDITLTWEPPMDVQFLAYDGYYIFWEDITDPSNIIQKPTINVEDPSASSYFFPGTGPDDVIEGQHLYRFYMQSYALPAGTSEDSNSTEALAFYPANQVQNVVIDSVEPLQISVTWEAPVPVTGQTAVNYSVQLQGNIGSSYANIGAPIVVAADASLQAVFTYPTYNIQNGVYYRVVITYNAETTNPDCLNVSSQFTSSSVLPDSCPAAASIPFNEISSGILSVTASWQAPIEDVSGQVGYEYAAQLQEYAGTVWTNIGVPIIIPLPPEDPSQNTFEATFTYPAYSIELENSYRVVIVYRTTTNIPQCPTAASAVITSAVTVEGCPAAATVTNVETSSGDESVTITWSQPEDVSGQVGVSYLIECFTYVGDIRVAYNTQLVDGSSNYVQTFTAEDWPGIVNGTTYYFKITYTAESEEYPQCPTNTSVYTSDVVVPTGVPIVYDGDISGCSILFTVNSNDTYQAGIPGVLQRATVHNQHELGTVTVNNVFEVVWAESSYPSEVGESLEFDWIVPITEVWPLGFTVEYHVTLTRVATPAQIDIDGTLYDTIPESRTYTVLISPTSVLDCIVGGYAFASNSSGMGSHYICSLANTILPCPGV